VVYLLDPAIEEAVAVAPGSGPDDVGERLADAVAAELRRLPPAAAVPHVLTDERCRPLLADRLRREFPRLGVVSYRDLPATTLLQPVARISW
jgi:flagellar biosynthesis component FlhA